MIQHIQTKKGKIALFTVKDDAIIDDVGKHPSILMKRKDTRDCYAIVVKLKHRRVTIFQSIARIFSGNSDEVHYPIHLWRCSEGDKQWVTKFYQDQLKGKSESSI